MNLYKKHKKLQIGRLYCIFYELFAYDKRNKNDKSRLRRDKSVRNKIKYLIL